MPIYAFQCHFCEKPHEVFAPIQQGPPPDLTCLDCQSPLRRVYTVPAVPKMWEPHYNHSVGRYVSNRREFEDALKQGSEQMSARTGMDHDFRPVEAGDAPGVTEEGMDSTYKAWAEQGIPES